MSIFSNLLFISGTALLLVLFPGMKENILTSQQDKVNTKGQILFYRSESPGKGGLYLMDENGDQVKKLGRSGSRPDHYPNWSPSGEYITFESYRAGGWRVWVMKADGSEARRLLPGRRGISSYEFDPSFSADGNRVFFTSGRDIYSVALDGSDLKNLTRTPNRFEYSPYQSPDGNRLLFVSKGDIHVMNMQTGEVVNLTPNAETIAYAPCWSPDGQKILYYSNRSGSFELYLMNADGSQSTFLLDRAEMKKNNFRTTQFVDAWDNNWGATDQYKASFSPDGQKILFSRNVDGNREIFKVGINGKGISRITTNNVHDGFPMWRPGN